MTLEELRNRALEDPMDIQWERLEDEKGQREFVEVMRKVDSFMMELEYLYTTMENGESVLFPGESSPLKWEDKEMITKKLHEELIAGYQMMDVYHRYVSIQQITKGSNHA